MTGIMCKTRRAFSLVEMVAATTILSMGVMTICTLSTRSVTRIAENRWREIAWDILDRQLSMIGYVGVDAFVKAGQTEGVLGSDDSPLGKYNWQGQVSETEIEGLYSIRMTIYWGPERGKHKIFATTIMTDTPAEYAEDEPEASTDDEGSSSGGQG